MSQQGIKLNFKIDEDYFLVHLLTRSSDDDDYSSTEFQDDIRKFKNYVWRKDREAYNLIAGNLIDAFLAGNGGLTRAAFHVSEYLQAVKQNRLFKKLIAQTERYLRFCQDQWEKNYPVASEFICDITGFDLNKKIDVYLTHPDLRNGDYLVKHNIIEWGHHEEWRNYQTVYLWHEILHSYLDVDPRYRWSRAIAYHDGESDFEEGVIELIADESLRSFLNHTKYPPFVGRENLAPFKKKLLPVWKQYLKQDKRDFLSFLKQAKQVFRKTRISNA